MFLYLDDSSTEPTNVKEALTSPVWHAAILEEFQALQQYLDFGAFTSTSACYWMQMGF